MRKLIRTMKKRALPPVLISKVADALPGLGIVAAVLGIIITMGHIDGDPAVVGHHVAAALVGTFMVVSFAYGFFSPMAANTKARNRNNARLLHVVDQCVR